jgi:NAD+ synthase (glutamine-hydrolysing)
MISSQHPQQGMLTLGLAQTNPTVGAIKQNAEVIAEQISLARESGVQVLLFPELAVCGYPPEDLLLREDFLIECDRAVQEIARGVDENMVVFLGFPEYGEAGPYNAMAVLHDGSVAGIYRKMHLPNYGVFDERRYFRAGDSPAMVRINGHLVGLTICEDIWEPGAPMSEEALDGATLIVNMSASPYQKGKGAQRENRLLAQRARDNTTAIAYCNLVGGQDELVFDGHSLVVDHEGQVQARARQFDEQLLVVPVDLRRIRQARLRDTRRYTLRSQKEVPILGDFDLPETRQLAELQARDEESFRATVLDEKAEIYGALVMGVRDYVHKNGFQRVLLGLSGGIDSALVALVAHDALGKENVTCVVMPSLYSSDATQSDARRMGDNLHMDTREIAISPMMESFETALANDFANTEEGVAEENLQARIRGNLLMALSNKFGWLLLTTGNKSEMAVGYATLYGDMCGGFAVIKDVPKLLVYELTEWRNQVDPSHPVPQDIIDRPPSAELKNDQQDSDSLPPYEILDPLLEMYVEHDASLQQLLDAGYDQEVVERILRLVDLAEYKRRQTPPGIKITPRAFGRDRRRPITNRYRASASHNQQSSAIPAATSGNRATVDEIKA